MESDRSDVGAIHRETAAAWDLVAREKYGGEFAAHVDHLRGGRDNLLPEERALLAHLLPGARVVQLQCSHGLDALGLLNAGAASVVGVDLSAEMVAQARAKAEAVGASKASFVVGDAADPPAELDGTADVVYAGRGSLPWLMALEPWGRGVARLLRPGGSVVVYEGHPLANLWDRESTGLALRPEVGYFDGDAREAPGFPRSVVERVAGENAPRMPERHWRPGQVMDALLSAGLAVRAFREYPTPFWDQFPHWPPGLRGRLPNAYGIVARRPSPWTRVEGPITGLKVRLDTGDVDATVGFYGDLLGLTVVDRWADGDDVGVIFGLDDSRAGPAFLEFVQVGAPSNGGASVQLRVDELHAFLDSLRGRWPVDGPVDRPWGSTYAYLADPDGVQVIVYEGRV